MNRSTLVSQPAEARFRTRPSRASGSSGMSRQHLDLLLVIHRRHVRGSGSILSLPHTSLSAVSGNKHPTNPILATPQIVWIDKQDVGRKNVPLEEWDVQRVFQPKMKR
jgi:hypothetical protein